ncbi:P-loop containing nucleoside triphosphate hydrolase protein [Macrophomina phaseolina]|uniref:Peroxisomal ATPase PEX1 n=1 Tax=Macrophomina phaseolina TaxID=35725 RepID=A0ABQ8GQ36_9PEZI|nr:P-loop containing nucleoside triphosphate hydrolase protein [Macrophomina phaseolina]
MAPAPKKPASVQAEVALLHSLKNCLVNLPASLVSVLVNANTVAQNVVVELTYRQPTSDSTATSNGSKSVQRSVFLGWTGMQAQRKPAPVVGRDGIAGSRGTPIGREQDLAVVELDATFGRLLGLSDSQKVGILLHLDPPQAHTINIEPLTPADWEMIELHAQFLELNFLSQVRALPNPAFCPPSEFEKQPAHPLTLHLSPTSTANIIVTSLAPSPPPATPFVKISPDAEVIVAPKTRQKPGRGDSRSVASTSRKSQGGRSSASTVRRRSKKDDASSRGAIFLRGLDRGLDSDWFDDLDENMQNAGLRVWVDPDILHLKALRGVTWVYVSIVKPTGIQEPVDPQKDAEAEKPGTKIVARLGPWDDAPDSQHVAISSTLCKALGAEGLLGGLVRIEAAPPQAGKSSLTKSNPIRALKVFPFATVAVQQNAGLKFGGESKQEKEEAAHNIRELYGSDHLNAILDGPLTCGMVLPPVEGKETLWSGAILRFDPPSSTAPESTKAPSWLLGAEKKNIPLEVEAEISKPPSALQSWSPGEALPPVPPTLVGIDALIGQLMSHLTHSSSVLLTGGLGAGKTGLAQLLAHRLRSECLYHTAYFPCRSLVTDETRVSTIKETLNRLFAAAAWGARLGGHAVVILDDLDKLCPVETELQVGGENGRSRHISESVCSIVKQYCSTGSGVVLLATGQSKEAVHNVIIGGHVVREIVSLKAPNKEGRRKVLEKLVIQRDSEKGASPNLNVTDSHAAPHHDANAWMDGSVSAGSRPSTSHRTETKDGFLVDPNIDFLDLAGQTDGYMPGDLVLLVSRARSESLIRSVSDTSLSASDPVTLTQDDFTRALDGFTPASLRNVTLQSSTTRWDSIGGLHATRQTLLETLQYPTTYAPIFAQCPLRLRSGLLLYGYPGCGKTLLASAVAGECGLNFISVKGPEILNKYIGASEKSVRDLFERAEAAKPCVLFFDEFDSIAPKRGHDSTGVTDRVVNQLLTQMDGAEGLSGVYILAATSRPDLIDPALLRPGRLDKSLLCDMPSFEERIDVLKAVTRSLRVSPTVLDEGRENESIREIARRTEGYSGADLQAVAYNAQLEAIHNVLGDGDLIVEDDASAGKKTNGVSNNKKKGGVSGLDFMHFRYGDEESAEEGGSNSAASAAAALGERARIAAKIQEMQALRRKQKQQQQQQQQQQSAAPSSLNPHSKNKAAGDADGNDEKENKEPVIEWRHFESSLASTRSSISEQERRRLAGIYREFVVGRNGEMPSGQGGTEIGGRTSLM